MTMSCASLNPTQKESPSLNPALDSLQISNYRLPRLPDLLSQVKGLSIGFALQRGNRLNQSS